MSGLTARQLAILAVAGIALWAAYLMTRHLVPVAAYGALAVPVAGAATLLALGRVEGQPADRLVVAAWRQLRSPRRLVVAPGGVAPVPSWVAGEPSSLPAPLRLPLGGVATDGVVDLGPDGAVLVCRASAVTFGLRTPGEQEALVAAFARWCNSLTEPVEVVVRAEPVDLAPMIETLEAGAPALPHPGLEAAARAHARFLGDLAATRRLLRREVLVVLRQPAADDTAARLHRRAEEAASALAAAGVTLRVLDGPAATACLWRAVDPASPARPDRLAAPDEVVTGAGR